MSVDIYAGNQYKLVQMVNFIEYLVTRRLDLLIRGPKVEKSSKLSINSYGGNQYIFVQMVDFMEYIEFFLLFTIRPANQGSKWSI